MCAGQIESQIARCIRRGRDWCILCIRRGYGSCNGLSRIRVSRRDRRQFIAANGAVREADQQIAGRAEAGS